MYNIDASVTLKMSSKFIDINEYNISHLGSCIDKLGTLSSCICSPRPLEKLMHCNIKILAFCTNYQYTVTQSVAVQYKNVDAWFSGFLQEYLNVAPY